jgi:hypothetical protein
MNKSIPIKTLIPAVKQSSSAIIASKMTTSVNKVATSNSKTTVKKAPTEWRERISP